MLRVLNGSSADQSSAAGLPLLVASKAQLFPFSFLDQTQNEFPRVQSLILHNRKKSHDARSGEYAGWTSTVMCSWDKIRFTDRAVCAGALS